MKSKSKEILIFIAIIAVQVLVMFYWAGVKSNFFVDELYSIGYANSFTETGDKSQYLTKSPQWKLNEWVDSSSLKRHIIVSDDETITNESAAFTLKKGFLRRNYNYFLNVSESIVRDNSISAKPGMLLNLCFFIISEISLIFLMNKLGFETRVQYLSLTMFGFSGYLISAVEYVRFYMLVIMLMILMLNILLSIWNTNDWKRIILYEILLLLLVFLQYKNTELTYVYFGSILFCFLIVCILTKKYKQIISLSAICLMGLYKLIFRTNYVKTFFNPSKYSEGMSVVYKATRNIRGFTLYAMKVYLVWLLEQFETLYFSSYWIVLLLIASVTICLILTFGRSQSKNVNNIHFKKLNTVSLFSIIVWLALLALSVILGRGTFLCALILVIVLVVVSINCFEINPGVLFARLSENSKFILIVSGATMIYTCFEMMAGHDVWRYYCYGMISFSIIFWYVIDRVLKNKRFINVRKQLYIIFTVFVFINSLIPFISRKIEYMYEDDKAMIENVHELGNMDVVLLVDIDDKGQVPLKETYDCVYIISENAKLYASDIDENSNNLKDYPDEFILWTQKDMDLEKVLSEIESEGYLTEDIGKDHESKAYHVVRD